MDTPWRTLIDVAALHTRLDSGMPTVLLDCGFDLASPGAGEAAWSRGHLPGALYVHLDRDLSGPKGEPGVGFSGRHPLPAREALAATAGRLGIAPGVQVVAYDAHGGPYAARAWWLLRWLGHDAVAVLDGGLPAWTAAGHALDSQASVAIAMAQAPYRLLAPAMPTIDAATLRSRLGAVRLLDARAAERFRGDVEPLDPVAGHIPGATLRWFKDNLLGDGRFKPAAQLRAEFDALASPPHTVVHQCGSGVTACHNLLAMAYAGLEGSTLYPGSWSEWCADPSRPVARG